MFWDPLVQRSIVIAAIQSYARPGACVGGGHYQQRLIYVTGLQCRGMGVHIQGETPRRGLGAAGATPAAALLLVLLRLGIPGLMLLLAGAATGC